MVRACAVILGVLISCISCAQVRQGKLVIGSNEIYELTGTDIIVVDTLIMMDSSKLILNKLKTDNFIHAHVALFHRGVVIDGKGGAGLRGRVGRAGSIPSTPCTDGGSGNAGSDGTNGRNGSNISIYFSEFIVKGTLTIDVTGGDGGDGGKGGVGGGGGPGTRICAGGNGGHGGNGKTGGNGGASGNISFISPYSTELRLLIGSKITIRNYGGNQGLGGDGGAGGDAGLGPSGSTMDGKRGKKGMRGIDGKPGRSGAINFDIK